MQDEIDLEDKIPRFRKMYIVEPSHDFSILASYTNSIVCLTSGTELSKDIEHSIRESILDFEPERDALVPMGKTVSCILTGLIIGSMFPNTLITLAVWRGSSYDFVKVLS